MAVNIGPKIGIEGEAEYRRQLQNIIQTQKTLKAQMTEMKSAWSEQTTAEQKATQQTNLLESQIKSQKQRVSELERGVEESAKAFGEADTRTLKWKEALANANAELNRMESELNDTPSGVELFGQKMQDAGQKIKKVGKGMETAGRGLTKYVTAPIVGLGTLAVKTTSDFDTSMSNVRAISGATGEEFEALRSKAREMGATTKYSASESADALGYMALAGWDADQMIDGLDGVLNLAAASGMDLAEASDLVTDYLTAFGKEAKDSQRMADQLAYAQSHSNTTTRQLGEAFGNSATQMHSAGQSMETTTAILEAFANQGLKGSEAGTALSAMMRDITQHMKDGKIYIGETAVSVMDANGNFRDMTDILADVESATNGMGTAEKNSALMATFTARSIKGVNVVLEEGTEAVKGYRDELYNADGTAKEMADIMQDNLAGQLKMLSSQLQEVAISFGDILIPHIRKAVEWIQKQVDKFNSLDEATKEQIVKFGLLAAAIGPVLLVGGKLVSSVGSIVEGGGKLIEWLGAVAPGFGGVLAAAGPVVGAFGLAAGAGVILGNVLKNLNEKYGETSEINDFNNYVRGTADAASEARDNLEESTEAIKTTSDNAKKVMKEADASAKMTDRYAEELYELAGKTKRTTEEQQRLEGIVRILNGIYPGFTDAVMDSNGELKMGVSELKNYIKEIENVAKVKALQGIIEDLTEKIVDATSRQIEAESALADAQEASAQAAEQKKGVMDGLSVNAERAEKATRAHSEAVKQEGVDIEAINAAEYERITQLGKMNNGLVELGDETVNASQAIEQLSDSENMASAEAEKTQKAIDANQKVIDETTEEVNQYQAQLDAVKESLGLTTEAEEENADAAGDSATAVGEAGEAYEEYADDVQNAAKELEEAEKKIRESYAQTKKSAKDSILGQKSLWQELEEQEGTTIEKMRANLAAHHEALSNWNTNASSLIHSTEYAVDEGFRNMVNYVIQGGEDLAPELQNIYNLWSTDKDALAELVKEYGYTYSDADKQAEILAYVESVLENGFEATNKALADGVEKGQKKVGDAYSNPKEITKGIQAGMGVVQKVAGVFGFSAGRKVPESVSTGMDDGKGEIDSASSTLEKETNIGIGSILKLAVESLAAGLAVSKGISLGLTTGKSSVSTAAESIKQEVKSVISEVSTLQSSAKMAGTDVAKSIKSGLENNTISGAMSSISSAVRTGIQAVDAQKTSARSAGTSVASEFVAGIQSKNSDATSAGRILGDNFANGLGSAFGNVSYQGSTLWKEAGRQLQAYEGSGEPGAWGRHIGDNYANGIGSAYGNTSYQASTLWKEAGNQLKAYEGSQDPWTWGRHLGDNFANGIGSAYGNVVNQANKLANAVASILQHSTPKEGPLKHDDVWGLHLGQNFAEGLRQSLPDIRSAVMDVADTAAMIPTETMLDIDAMTGRNVIPEALTSDNIMDAFMLAAENIDWRVEIGNREFGRILREQGVYA